MNGDGQQWGRKPGPASRTINPVYQQTGQGQRTSEPRPSRSSASSSNSNNDFRSRDRRDSDKDGVKQKTTCLFCSDPVSINGENCNVNDPKTSDIMKVLCHHFNVNRQNIPNECNEAMLPFCDSCKDAVLKIWQAEQTIQEARATIARESSTIERTVVDAEILTKLTSPSSSNSIESKKFTLLRDMVLESYRNKLLMKKRLREAAVLGRQERVATPTLSPQVVMRDRSITRQYEAANGSQVSRMPDDEVNVLTDAFYPEVQMEETAEPVGIADGRSGSSNHQEEEIETEMENLWMNHEEGGDSVQGVYNPNSCSAVITEVYSTAPLVKQEPSSFAEVTMKRRYIFRGVQIYRVNDDVNDSSLLQCSVCKFTVPILDNSHGLSAYTQITRHISQKHRSGKGKAATVVSVKKKRRYEFSCRVCNATFRFKKDLYLHKPSHSQEELDKFIEVRECDICGRTVKGGNGNLKIHKFSHKNEEEKRAAVNGGDTWARTAMMNQRLKQTKKRGGRKQKLRKGKTSKTLPSINKWQCNEPKKTLKCDICEREFTRTCHLANHLKGHYRRSLNVEITSTTTADNQQMPYLEPVVDDEESNEVEILED